MIIRPIMGKEFCDLHQLMLREGFPQTPKDFYQAKTFLDECLCYGKFDDKGHIIAAFIVGELTQESAFLDVVCCQEKRGRWLSFGLMRRIMQFLFHDLGLHYVWVQPQIKESYKLAIDMGFQLVHNQHTENGLCLILTKQKYLSSKFNK